MTNIIKIDTIHFVKFISLTMRDIYYKQMNFGCRNIKSKMLKYLLCAMGCLDMVRCLYLWELADLCIKNLIN